MYAVVLKYESIILTVQAFISELLPIGVTVTVASGPVIVVRKGPAIPKIGNNKTDEHDRNIKANGISLL